MKEYYIGLKMIGITNDILINIMLSLKKEELKNIFLGNYLEVNYRFNLGLEKYHDKLIDLKQLDYVLSEARNILNKNKSLDIKTIIFKNRLYPERLKIIKNPPAILYVKGSNILKKDLKSIACVGTRNPSDFGINTTKAIIGRLVEEDFTIISGLADGIDKIAHESAILNGGRTIGVVAHGLDMIYPNENKKLANDILTNNGCIISEYPVGSKPEKYRFVERNRIVSGLSKGILMCEANIKSGTAHTINFGIEQNKKIFVPISSGNMLINQNTLNHKLSSEGKAQVLRTPNDYIDIVQALGYKIKNNKNLIERKNRRYVLNAFKNMSIDKFSDLEKIKNKKITFNVNGEEYDKFRKIIKERGITNNEIMDIIIQSINSYNQ